MKKENLMPKGYAILLLLSLIGCNVKKEQSTIEISSKKNTEFIFLDSVFTAMRFIPLETKEACLISSIHKCFKLYNNYIIWDNVQVSLLMFSDRGKFIKRIGQKGKGKNEYLRIIDLSVSQDSLYVLVNNENCVYVHNKEGDFVRKEDLPFHASSFVKTNSGYLFYTGYLNSKANCNYRLINTNNQLKIIGQWLKIPYGNNLYLMSRNNNNEITQTNNGYLVTECYNQTIYKFTDNKLIALVKFDIDNSANCMDAIMNNRHIQNKMKAIENEKSSIYIRKVVETSKYFLIDYYKNYDSILKTAIINKKDRKGGVLMGSFFSRYKVSLSLTASMLSYVGNTHFVSNISIFNPLELKSSMKEIQAMNWINSQMINSESNPVLVEFN